MESKLPSIPAGNKPVVYVAGPFRGKQHGNFWQIDQNIRHAAALGLAVWGMGAACITPHLNTAPYQGSLPDSIWLEGDLCILDRCDAIIMTTNWESSVGATAERDYANIIGIPVFYEEGVDQLERWIREYRGNSGYGSKTSNGSAKQGLRGTLGRLFKDRKALPHP